MFGSIPGSNVNWSYPISDERGRSDMRQSCGISSRRYRLTRSLRSLQDGLATPAVVLAGYESAFAGAPVSLPLEGKRDCTCLRGPPLCGDLFEPAGLFETESCVEITVGKVRSVK